VDGANDETTELLTEPPEETTPPAPAKRADQVSAEKMLAYLRQAHFDGTRGRRGYHQGDVNALLLRLIEAVQEGEPLGHLVRRHKLTTVRLEHGYEIRDVDEFLDAVVDLDPHATHGLQAIRRSGLVTKLFGHE
jgi:hypothetical protein